MKRLLLFFLLWLMGACVEGATEPLLPRCTLTREGGVLVDACR